MSNIRGNSNRRESVPKRMPDDDDSEYNDQKSITSSPGDYERRFKEINLKEVDYPLQTNQWKKVLEAQDELDKIAGVCTLPFISE